jgi:hypothetical protein
MQIASGFIAAKHLIAVSELRLFEARAEVSCALVAPSRSRKSSAARVRPQQAASDTSRRPR